MIKSVRVLLSLPAVTYLTLLLLSSAPDTAKAQEVNQGSAAPSQSTDLLSVFSSGFCNTCTCYFSSDCGGSQTCSGYGRCTKDGKIDGTCSGGGGIFLSSDLPFVAKAVDNLFQAYQTAGSVGGGGPNLELLRQSQNLPLSLQGHLAAELLVTDALDVLVGFDFIQPGLYSFCRPVFQIHTFIQDFPPQAAAMVNSGRRGIVEALQARNPELVATPIREFWRLNPDYKPLHSGRCYPHGHREFQYRSAGECQVDTLKRLVAKYLGMGK